jgi:hypothetical protein
MILVLIVVVGQGRIGPVSAILLAVPLYIGMLIADVVSRARQNSCRAIHTSDGIDSRASLLSGEAN